MKNIIVTDIHLPVRLFLPGLLKYFDPDELRFYITDICYSYKNQPTPLNFHDKVHAKRMVEQGRLEVVGLDETQMGRLCELYQHYKPRFITKTVSALVLAQVTGFKLISEDELLREVATQDLKIRAHDKEWLITDLLHEIGTRGVNLDIEFVKQLI